MKNQNTKTQKGITLVALVITIIVLLILAAVAIGAIQNKGIIKYAQNASADYKAGEEKEKTVLDSLLDKIKENVPGNNEEGNEENSGTGDENQGDSSGSQEGESTGNQNQGSDANQGESSGSGENSGGSGEGVGGTESEENNAPVDYLGKYVRYDVDGDGIINTDNEYEAILWRVLTDDTEKVELITADALGELDLTPTDLNDARTKYNNVVELMVAECKRVTGIQTNIRNVGGPATEEPLSNTNTVDFSTLEEFEPTVPDENFAKYEGAINGFRKGDDNFEEDFAQMAIAGVAMADNQEEYWVASRRVAEYATNVDFTVLSIEGRVNHRIYTTLFLMRQNGKGSFYLKLLNQVRPILTLSSGSLTALKGEGTTEQPFEIYQVQ